MRARSINQIAVPVAGHEPLACEGGRSSPAPWACFGLLSSVSSLNVTSRPMGLLLQSTSSSVHAASSGLLHTAPPFLDNEVRHLGQQCLYHTLATDSEPLRLLLAKDIFVTQISQISLPIGQHLEHIPLFRLLGPFLDCACSPSEPETIDLQCAQRHGLQQNCIC